MDTPQITAILNKFLEDNDFECTTKLDTDFAYYYSHSLITYALIVTEKLDRIFYNFAIENGLAIDCGNFILSFFHELGHNETLDLVNTMDYAYSQDVKATLSDSDEDMETYMRLPDEIIATEWAIDYINNHYDKISKLAKDLYFEMKKLDITD